MPCSRPRSTAAQISKDKRFMSVTTAVGATFATTSRMARDVGSVRSGNAASSSMPTSVQP